MPVFNEDTRVKIPATIQFLRLGYEYQSLEDIDLDSETRIAVNRFKTAISKINGKKYSAKEIQDILAEIRSLICNSDMGKAFYRRLIDPQDKPKLVDFEKIENNDFSVVNELSFGREGFEDDREGSFRPDITILINGIPLAFLEVKPPNNEGGIQAEFNRMLNKRLEKSEYKKYFNMLQVVSFSNNMDYEDNGDSAMAEDVKAGSFYTTPNGFRTTFSFFREESPKTIGFIEIPADKIKEVLVDNHYESSEADTDEFKTNLEPDTPCNRFVTSMFDKERITYFLRYGITYVDGRVPEKHIMRYPQFFASQALKKRLDDRGKAGIIWHTQGSGKTELAAFSTRILRDYYAKKEITARFYYVVDRLDLLVQVSGEMSNRGLNVINVNSKSKFEKELNKPISDHITLNTDGEITVVNIQKFEKEMPVARNDYNARIQRIFFIDEAHRSYRNNGVFFMNLMLVDENAIYVALTGTPILSKEDRTNLMFGDYIHTYFYDKSIADGYTLRIKKESITTTARAEIRENLNLENPRARKSDVMESDDYIQALCKFIKKDFIYFRQVNNDKTIGGMIVCSSNPQAKKIKKWFDKQNDLSAGLVISDEDIVSSDNKQTQINFKEELKPDILIVHQMLTTGYDVNRLKKMYLLRNAKEHTLLQTISRVNRPYKNPDGKTYHYGYIVDFVDISEEYDRTITMYLKEIEEDFSDKDEKMELKGLIIGPDEVNAKYQEYNNELGEMIETANLEQFNRSLVNMEKDVLLKIRHLLNEIKTCYIEFKLSRAEKYAKQIDIDHIKKLQKAVQARIDFVNLSSKPMTVMNIISNKEIVEILYEFLRIRTEILEVPQLTEEMKRLDELISKVQNEIKKNRNPNQIEMVELEEVLRKLFEKMKILSLNEINKELCSILEKVKQINKVDEQLSERYGGSYAFVKTYTDTVRNHPEYNKENIGKILDIVCEAVKRIRTANILILQRRDNFVSHVNEMTIINLVDNGLFEELSLDDWYDDILTEIYNNMKTFKEMEI